MRVVVQSWSPSAFEQWKSVVVGPGFRRDDGEFADAFFKQADRIPALPPANP
jgi:hypothetical protein